MSTPSSSRAITGSGRSAALPFGHFHSIAIGIVTPTIESRELNDARSGPNQMSALKLGPVPDAKKKSYVVEALRLPLNVVVPAASRMSERSSVLSTVTPTKVKSRSPPPSMRKAPFER